MPILRRANYKTEAGRYRHYYLELKRFYQKPVVQVSSAVLFTLATIIFFAVVAIRPTLQTIAELLRKIEDQKQILEQAEKKSAALATAQQQYDAFRPYLTSLDAAIPPQYELQKLLVSIEAIAGQLGIPLTSVKIENVEFPPPSGNKKVREMTFQLGVEAPYPETRAFVTALQKLPRLMTVESVSIATPERGRENPSAFPNAVFTNMGCRAYYVIPTEKKP